VSRKIALGYEYDEIVIAIRWEGESSQWEYPQQLPRPMKNPWLDAIVETKPDAVVIFERVEISVRTYVLVEYYEPVGPILFHPNHPWEVPMNRTNHTDQ
jgi:hypothetical protein